MTRSRLAVSILGVGCYGQTLGEEAVSPSKENAGIISISISVNIVSSKK